jgi:hypothetical protein
MYGPDVSESVPFFLSGLKKPFSSGFASGKRCIGNDKCVVSACLYSDAGYAGIAKFLIIARGSEIANAGKTVTGPLQEKKGNVIRV